MFNIIILSHQFTYGIFGTVIYLGDGLVSSESTIPQHKGQGPCWPILLRNNRPSDYSKMIELMTIR